MATVIEWTADTQGAISDVYEVPGAVNFAVQREATGSPSSVTVVLEGSLTGNTFTALATASGGQVVPATVPDVRVTRYIRLRLSTLTGGTDPVVTAVAVAV